MNYNEFRQETKLFLNKAMDIYSTIKDRNLNTVFKKNTLLLGKYKFSDIDKKVLSLFMAGFLLNGNLKEILSGYNDINLSTLLNFINIKKEDIIPIDNSKYEEFFNKNLKVDLTNIIKNYYANCNINFITPEVIVNSLSSSGLSNSKILDNFSLEYTGYIFICHHSIFKKLDAYTSRDGSISKSFPKIKINKKRPLFFSDIEIALKTNNLNNIQQESQKMQPKKSDDSIWSLLDDIQNKFIGQEEAVEGLFYNIVNNQQLAEIDDIFDGQRSIIFLDGPTGTGKTAITREITEKLDIPFVASSVTNYSSAGYVGGNITDILKDLYKKANGNLKKAQKGIVVFDEFDKIAYSQNDGLEMKKAVQQQLLDFLGGGKYNIDVGDNMFTSRKIEFDTSKLTFVCLGALTDLRSRKTEKKQTIGFGQSTQSSNQDQNYSITPQDLINIGLERELVGRFNTYLHTDDYSKKVLTKILKESTISPLIGFKKWIESKEKKLIVDEDVYDLIAEQAYELNIGARSLQTVMNNIRTHFLKEVLRGTNDTIYLDSETVIQISNQTINRRGRR